MELAGKRVAVVGLGASGVAAAKLCLKRGAKVTGVDEKPLGALAPAARALSVDVVPQAAARFDGFDLVVVSPGVPAFPALEAATCPVVGELELAYQCQKEPRPIVAIGGTNGKSTVTSLVAALLEGADKKVFAGGNLGEPWAAHVDDDVDVVVLEVSSFQMERLDQFRPNVAVLLNITDDHLDRHATFDDYARAKGNCFVRQTKDDLAVIPADDPICLREARRGQGRVAFFETIDGAAIKLQGAHNARNAAAAMIAVQPFGVSDDVVKAVLSTFDALPHRMILVSEVNGVRFYDDSKGTNVGASVTALLGLREEKAVLIAGGRDKHGSYAPLAEAMKKKGRAAVVIGEAAARIEEALAPVVTVVHATSMDEAVRKAAEIAMRGDAVLLSPACSSFDMFRDYKQRGDDFVRAVRALQSAGEAR